MKAFSLFNSRLVLSALFPFKPLQDGSTLAHQGRGISKLLTLSFLFIFSFLSPVLAQHGGEGGGGQEQVLCTFGTSFDIQCNGLVVTLSGNPNWPTHYWDFGDGSPIVSGGPSFSHVTHNYGDVNPVLHPITARHSLDQSFWCEATIDFPGIFVGDGCGSTRLVSQLISHHILPANGLSNQTLYVFGNLEVDIPYSFSGCTIYFGSGGKMIVKNGGTATLQNHTVVDAHVVSGVCNYLWNGIEVVSGGILNTSDAVIRNAYYGIRTLSQPGPGTFPPTLNINNTIFQQNFVGIYAANGGTNFASFSGNTFEGSGNNAINSPNPCVLVQPIAGVAFQNRTYAGIYIEWVPMAVLSSGSAVTTFKDLQAGIVCLNSSLKLNGCKFDNINKLFGLSNSYHATAVTYVGNNWSSFAMDGLGKEGAPTIHNCEMGIHFTVKNLNSFQVTNCRMEEVQTGILVDALPGNGFITQGNISNNHIECTKYLGNLQTISTGIQIDHPNINNSTFSVRYNDIIMVQPGAFNIDQNYIVPGIDPTGIRIIGLASPSHPGESMSINVTDNNVELKKGILGICMENISSGNIFHNIVNNRQAIFDLDHLFAGIKVTGGTNNSVTCNWVAQNTVGTFVGIVIFGSIDVILSTNRTTDLLGSFSLVYDNGTNCDISYNDFQAYNVNQTGLFYSETRTGPQYLRGNDWLGTFASGATFKQGAGAFTYCSSLYTVSPDANIGGSSGNPIDAGTFESCGYWFTIDGTEDDVTCLDPNREYKKNNADLEIANGGAQLLSPGYAWSAEMGLYQKFTDHPELIGSDRSLQNFLQAADKSPIAGVYNIRKQYSELDKITPAVDESIQQSLAAQTDLTNNLINLDQKGANAFSPTGQWATLSEQLSLLQQSQDILMTEVLEQRAKKAQDIIDNIHAVQCDGQPCANELFFYELYLETQILHPRELTKREFNQLRSLAASCPGEGGPVVFMARSLLFLLTGESVETQCPNGIPQLSGFERSADASGTNSSDLQLMPNPANSGVTILLPDHSDGAALLVQDGFGRTVANTLMLGSGQKSVYVSTESLPSGYYVVSLQQSAGIAQTKRLIVLH